MFFSDACSISEKVETRFWPSLPTAECPGVFRWDDDAVALATGIVLDTSTMDSNVSPQDQGNPTTRPERGIAEHIILTTVTTIMT